MDYSQNNLHNQFFLKSYYSFCNHYEKQLSILKGQLRKVIKRISKSDNEAAKEGLRMELEKLKNMKGEKTFSQKILILLQEDFLVKISASVD